MAAPPSRASEPDAAFADAQPLAALLERVRADFGDAKVLKVELETAQSGGAKVLAYEIKLFTSQGAILKALYDARTLERLTVEGRRQRGRGSDD